MFKIIIKNMELDRTNKCHLQYFEISTNDKKLKSVLFNKLNK